MRALWLLILLPTYLLGYAYYTNEDQDCFKATLKEVKEVVALDQSGVAIVELNIPKEFRLKNIAYDYDQQEFKWGREAISEKGDSLLITLFFEPQKEGNLYLNLPTFHLVSNEDPKKYVSLHPPLISCRVHPPFSNPLQEIGSSGLLALDLQRSIEVSAENKKQLMQSSLKSLISEQKTMSLMSPKHLWKWVILAVLFAFAGFKVGQWLHKRRLHELLFGVVQDPQKEALNALDSLKSKRFVERGLFEEFYVELTLIVRSYIEKKFKIKAPEQTTQEFLQELIEKKLFEAEMNLHLEDFLKFADLVKFAKHHPNLSDCSDAEIAAYNFIQLSSPKTSQM